MSCDFKSTAYLSHRLKGSWIKNHAITIHAGYSLRVQFSEHVCVLGAIFPTLKRQMVKVIASFLKGDSSAVSEEVYKRACNKIPRKKSRVKETWMKCIFFKRNVWNAHNLISATPGQKKKWSKSDLIVNCERMCCRWLWLRSFDFLSGSYYPSQVHVLSIQRYRVSNQMVIVSSWSWNCFLDGLL